MTFVLLYYCEAYSREAEKEGFVISAYQDCMTALTSEEERQLSVILGERLAKTGFYLSFDDLHQFCIGDGYVDRSPENTRKFIECYIGKRHHILKMGKTLKGEDGYMRIKGAF